MLHDVGNDLPGQVLNITQLHFTCVLVSNIILMLACMHLSIDLRMLGSLGGASVLRNIVADFH